MTKVVEQVVAGLGSLDILVNNAGIIRRAPVLEFSEKDWDDVMQINLKAVFLLSQAAGRVMVAQRQRQDHQHRLDALLPGRHSGAIVHRLEKRRGGHHPPDGE